ncbi:MAG: superoxide dismutase [Candidatus Babeliales bacterium]|nr:superoxide dismutase [Candidatus Babeliales bacterium]
MTKFILPPLPYSFGALEPYIDAQTMEIHHDRHHATYVEKLNHALEKHTELQSKTVQELLLSLDKLPAEIKTEVRNNGGGHLNHSMFWLMLKQNGGKMPQGKVYDAIKKDFNNFEAFKVEFNAKAKSVFGSGWAWLVINKDGKLEITATHNQDNPIEKNMQPILGLDVWEHAYYLKYQNKRPDYINAWWNVINWEQVEENYDNILG